MLVMGECYRDDGTPKNRYKGILEAQRAVREVEAKFAFAMRAYRCPQCGNFHLARRTHGGSHIILMEHLKEKKDDNGTTNDKKTAA